MDPKRREQCAAEARGLMGAAFTSPIWNRAEGKWFRALTLADGRPDPQPHFYYDLCNIYAFARVLRMTPEFAPWREPWMDAVNWLFWSFAEGDWVGYAGTGLADKRDRYSMALAPAALAAAFTVAGRPALRSRAVAWFRRYRERFPVGSAPNVQASNHAILSALALGEATGDARYLADARAEAALLLDRCRFTDGPAAGCFTDDFRQTAFPRHCYGSWAMTALYERDPDERWIAAATASMEWWQARQLPDGGFHFFFDAQAGDWSDRTVYSVHQKGMFLHSACAIDRHAGGRYAPMIERAMACCDRPEWRCVAPEGWWCYRRSDADPGVVFSYELGWEVLGLSLVACSAGG